MGRANRDGGRAIPGGAVTLRDRVENGMSVTTETAAPATSPRLSVVMPAMNEARNLPHVELLPASAVSAPLYERNCTLLI